MIPALVPALSVLVASVHVSVLRRLLENHHCQGEKDHSHTSGLSEEHTGAQFESAVFHSQDGPGGPCSSAWDSPCMAERSKLQFSIYGIHSLQCEVLTNVSHQDLHDLSCFHCPVSVFPPLYPSSNTGELAGLGIHRFFLTFRSACILSFLLGKLLTATFQQPGWL